MPYPYRTQQEVKPEVLAELKAQQEELASLLRLDPLPEAPRYIGGADISYDLARPDLIYAGIIVLEAATLKPVAHSLVAGNTAFPYVPGFLSFREAPALQEAWHKLPLQPDLLVMDGHGIAHPRSLGIASHLGILLDSPTMGCAKKRLVGSYEEPEEEAGNYSPLTYKKQQLGYVYRSRSRVKPVFISPGHKMTLQDCLRMAPKILGKYRIPEPTRLAHQLVNRFRSGQEPAGSRWYPAADADRAKQHDTGLPR